MRALPYNPFFVTATATGLNAQGVVDQFEIRPLPSRFRFGRAIPYETHDLP